MRSTHRGHLPFDAAVAVDATVESILVTDAMLGPPGPRIIYANPVFERMMGWRAEEVIGRTPRTCRVPTPI
jgi:two-component system OmpR family sensor kinase